MPCSFAALHPRLPAERSLSWTLQSDSQHSVSWQGAEFGPLVADFVQTRKATEEREESREQSAGAKVFLAAAAAPRRPAVPPSPVFAAPLLPGGRQNRARAAGQQGGLRGFLPEQGSGLQPKAESSSLRQDSADGLEVLRVSRQPGAREGGALPHRESEGSGVLSLSSYALLSRLGSRKEEEGQRIRSRSGEPWQQERRHLDLKHRPSKPEGPDVSRWCSF